jgi:negative regulator of flagellin synthesis FlgM
MKIDPTVKTSAPAAIDERVRSPKQENPQSGGKPRSDVQLSPLSSQLHDIEAGMEAGGAVDSARVAEVKRSIDEGRFQVDSAKVADRLVAATREFLRSHKS